MDGLWQWCDGLESFKLMVKRIHVGAEVRHLGVHLGPPSLEIILRHLEIVDGDLHIIDTSVPFVDPLGLLIKLAEDERELNFNFHGDLEAGAVVVRQDEE